MTDEVKVQFDDQGAAADLVYGRQPRCQPGRVPPGKLRRPYNQYDEHRVPWGFDAVRIANSDINRLQRHLDSLDPFGYAVDVQHCR